MDDTLPFFYFSSGIPFAYLAFYGGLAVAALAAAALAVRSLARRRRGRAAGYAVAGAAAVGLLVAAGEAGGAVEWSTDAVTPEVLTGMWTREGTVLRLQADSTYVCEGLPREVTPCARAGEVGRWAYMPQWAVTLSAPTGVVYRMTMLRVRGREHLILDPGDPDVWDGDLGFARRP